MYEGQWVCGPRGAGGRAARPGALNHAPVFRIELVQERRHSRGEIVDQDRPSGKSKSSEWVALMLAAVSGVAGRAAHVRCAAAVVA